MLQSRVFFTVKLCVGFLLPSAVYSMGVQIYLLSTHQLDFMIRPNSILLLTTSILTILFLLCWTLARSNGPIRPPSSGKRIAFAFSLLSTIFWLASFWTGADVARQGMACREGVSLDASVKVMPWSDGLPCRLHRVGVAFTAIGLLSSLVILAAMVEISDRPFGGVSTEATISWTAEKFREALMDLAVTDGGKEDRSRAGSVGSGGTVGERVEVVQDTI